MKRLIAATFILGFAAAAFGAVGDYAEFMVARDFSNFQGGGAVMGQHFNDLNANGVRDDGEVGLDGWTVEGVDPVSGQVVGSAITASEDLDGDGVIDPATEMGLYSLASMPVGTFDIRLKSAISDCISGTEQENQGSYLIFPFLLYLHQPTASHIYSKSETC